MLAVKNTRDVEMHLRLSEQEHHRPEPATGLTYSLDFIRNFNGATSMPLGGEEDVTSTNTRRTSQTRQFSIGKG